MSSLSPKSQKSVNNVLRRINLSLSPDKYFSKRLELLPNLQKLKKPKRITGLFRSQHRINEYSQKLSLKDKEALDLNLKKEKMIGLSKCLKFSLSVSKQTQKGKINYFRPKPLTPASLRMFNFSGYKHRLTSSKNYKIATPLPRSVIDLTLI